MGWAYFCEQRIGELKDAMSLPHASGQRLALQPSGLNFEGFAPLHGDDEDWTLCSEDNASFILSIVVELFCEPSQFDNKAVRAWMLRPRSNSMRACIEEVARPGVMRSLPF